LTKAQLNNDMTDFIKNANLETLNKLVKKHASPYKMTDRGLKYYKDLTTKYLSGLKIGDDKLIILCGIHTFGSRMNQLDESISDEIFDEIALKVNIDMGDNSVIDTILIYLRNKGFLEDNPNFNPEFNTLINDVVTKSEERKGIFR